MSRRSGSERAGPPASLYVHVPFCEHRCHYCDFSVTCRRRPPVESWLAAVSADLRLWFEARGWSRGARLETIYVGGGTPSLLGPGAFTKLAALLRRWFRWDAAQIEWTAEANPRSLTADVLGDWAHAGVNRISIGVQAFDDDALRWLGRLHDAEEAASAIDRAKDAGFRNLNVDLMFGLPDDVGRDWVGEIERLRELDVPHVSLYGLTAETRTPLGRRMELGRVRLATEDRYGGEYLEARDLLVDAGYGHYEISNLARPGAESRHNWQYWDRSPYLGVGPSAHSFLPPLRVWNVYRWDAYRKAATSGGELRAGSELVVGEAERLERLWLGLRTRKGVARADPTWRPLLRNAAGVLEAWEGQGWLEWGTRMVLTAEGWLRIDALVAELARRLPAVEAPVAASADVERT
ncbi:MAG: radical SAM family heme chaperone HemW [Gemmatimonadota bacterium]